MVKKHRKENDSAWINMSGATTQHEKNTSKHFFYVLSNNTAMLKAVGLLD